MRDAEHLRRAALRGNRGKDARGVALQRAATALLHVLLPVRRQQIRQRPGRYHNAFDRTVSEQVAERTDAARVESGQRLGRQQHAPLARTLQALAQRPPQCRRAGLRLPRQVGPEWLV